MFISCYEGILLEWQMCQYFLQKKTTYIYFFTFRSEATQLFEIYIRMYVGNFFSRLPSKITEFLL